MQDQEIVELYWRRDEQAIRETQEKYERYLTKVAYHILGDEQDSRECVNDTYWKAWNAIPPHRPEGLGSFLCRITRQQSIDIYRTRNRGKRKATEYALSLSELEECVSDRENTQQIVDRHLLEEAICCYLRSLPSRKRIVFVARYFYLDPIKEIAEFTGDSEAKIKSILHRTREGLRAYLKQEGYEL